MKNDLKDFSTIFYNYLEYFKAKVNDYKCSIYKFCHYFSTILIDVIYVFRNKYIVSKSFTRGKTIKQKKAKNKIPNKYCMAIIFLLFIFKDIVINS